MGIRKKITTGFLTLEFLLVFAGLVSLFELSRLSRNTQNVLDASTRNMTLSVQMLNALQDQNTALLSMVASGRGPVDSLYLDGRRRFDKALSEATVTVRDLTELDAVYSARETYYRLTDDYFYGKGRLKATPQWFSDIYANAYRELTTSVKEYMASSQNSLVMRASRLEDSAYRAITPSLISLFVVVLIVMVFFYMIDHYYISPTLKINQGLNGYIASRIPFKVDTELHDEIRVLKENIDKILLLLKGKRSE